MKLSNLSNKEKVEFFVLAFVAFVINMVWAFSITPFSEPFTLNNLLPVLLKYCFVGVPIILAFVIYVSVRYRKWWK